MRYGDLDTVCNYCWRPAIAQVVKHHNTLIRTLLGLPRPRAYVCKDHLYAEYRDWPKR